MTSGPRLPEACGRSDGRGFRRRAWKGERTPFLDFGHHLRSDDFEDGRGPQKYRASQGPESHVGHGVLGFLFCVLVPLPRP